MVKVIPLRNDQVPDLRVGQHVYSLTSPGRGVRYTVTSAAGTRGAVAVVSDLGAETGIVPHVDVSRKWFIEDAAGQDIRCYEVAGHVVYLRVVVPVAEAATKDDALKVGEAIAASTGREARAWSAQPFSDQTWHVFDDNGWPVAENLPDSERVGFDGTITAGHTVYDGADPIRECHADLIHQEELARAGRRGPAPDPDVRARVIAGLMKDLSYAQIAAKTGSSRQRVGQIVNALRREVSRTDFTAASATAQILDLARFAEIDERTDKNTRVDAVAYLKRASPLFTTA